MTDPTRSGTISHMGPGYPDDYLALPIGRGFTVELCGVASCRKMTSNDVGPNQSVHPDRIADVSVATFEQLCGLPASAGLCQGSWTIVGDVSLPATETQPPDISLASAVFIVVGIVLLVTGLFAAVVQSDERRDARRRNRR